MDYFNQQSDQELIESYFKGEEKSLEILIKRYLKPIYNFVYQYVSNSQDTEDITQDVFIKIWRNFRKFDRNRNFKTWIFSIAKNTCFDWLKKKKPIVFSMFDTEEGKNILSETLIDPSPLPDELAERADISEMLGKAIKKLPPPYRLVLILRQRYSFTFCEIAEILKEPIDTVKTRYRRGTEVLKKIFQNK